MRYILASLAAVIATVTVTPVEAAERVYSFEGVDRNPYPTFTRGYGTITVSEDFTITQMSPDRYSANQYGKLEVFGERADGTTVRGMVSFGPRISELVFGPTDEIGFYIGSMVGGLQSFGSPLGNYVGTGKLDQLFNKDNFSTMFVSVGGQEDRPTPVGPNSLLGSFTLTSIREVGAVPEPTTWALMILGFGAVGYSMRRRPKAVVRVA